MRAPDASTAPGASARRDVALRRGEVVGERYQVLEPLSVDPYAASYRAFDQETEADVCLRIIHPDLLPDEASRHRLVGRLEEALGRGGRFLAPCLDVDRDGPRVYVVEPKPTGISLRTLFDQRAAEARRFRPDEVLPIVARLGAALAAIPRGFRHGDVRAGQIWVQPEGLTLTGGLLVSALPEGAVAATLQGDPLRTLYAPELRQGLASPSTDLYGVAIVALEALAGTLPSNLLEGIPASLGGVGDALAALLEPDPALRSGTLDALLSALARQADAPVPILDIGPYHDARARSARPLPGEPTDPTADVIRTTSMPPPDDVTMPRIDLRGTPYSFDRPESGPPPADSRDLTRRVSYPPRPEAGERDGAREEQGADELVTRPSQDRRWLGRVIEGAAAGGTQEISLDQIVEENAPAPYDEPFPAAPASLDELPSPDEFDDDALTIVSGADLIEDAPIPKNGTYNSLTLEGLKPIPRPKRLESILPPPTTNPSGENYVLFDDSGHFDASVSEALRIPPPPLQIEPSVTTLRPPRSTKRTGTARKVLVGSLLTALAIVASSLVFATYERVEAERQREQRLEERFRELTTRNAGEP